MLSIAQITQPGLQRRGIVLGDETPVGANDGIASNGCPFSGCVDKGDIDVSVFGEVVGLSGLSIGVE